MPSNAPEYMTLDQVEPGSAATRYSQLETDRDAVVQRAREAARLTIPMILPDQTTRPDQLHTVSPYQSIGSRGVNNLASKILLALFPPTAPFFRYTIDDALLNEIEEAAEDEDIDVRSLAEKALGGYERAIMNRLEQYGMRANLFELLKHLVVVGNGALWFRRNGVQFYRVDSYVVKRDAKGNLLEMIVRDLLDPRALPDVIYKMIPQGADGTTEKVVNEKTIALYTRFVKRSSGKFDMWQEVNDQLVPESNSSYPAHLVPFIPLRFSRHDGEDYGRGHVKLYFGDLASAEALTQSLLEAAAAMAKILFFIDPGGSTNEQEVSDSPSGAVIKGRAGDVTVMQMEKYPDLKFAADMLTKIERRLSTVFLLSSDVTRDAERVTAEEIRLIATELEDTLGGVFALMSTELQAPMVELVANQMEKENKLPVLPEGIIHPKIISGLDALGRQRDAVALRQWLADAVEALGAETVSIYVKPDAYMTRSATALNIDSDGILRSDAEVKKLQQAQQQQELASQVLPQAVKTGLEQQGQVASQQR